MNRSLRSFLALSFLLILGWPALAHQLSSQSAPSKPRITVLLYNYVEAPEKTLEQAKGVAARVFDKIGVEAVWLDCFSPAAKEQVDPACRRKPTPTTLRLRLVARSTNDEIFGFGMALLAMDGGFSSLSSVFYERVEELVRLRGSTRVALLGNIMAHEIGHLLLGIGSHSSRGIMRFPWKGKEVELADKGWLRFTPRQAKRIRVQVRARVRAEKAQGTD